MTYRGPSLDSVRRCLAEGLTPLETAKALNCSVYKIGAAMVEIERLRKIDQRERARLKKLAENERAKVARAELVERLGAVLATGCTIAAAAEQVGIAAKQASGLVSKHKIPHAIIQKRVEPDAPRPRKPTVDERWAEALAGRSFASMAMKPAPGRVSRGEPTLTNGSSMAYA